MSTNFRYIIHIKRDYSKFWLYNKGIEVDNYSEITKLDITKLLTGDILDNNFELIQSPLKEKIIPAIIKLDKPFKHLGNKAVYKCYPNNKLYPVFLVKKINKKGFKKYQTNQYVLIRYSEWTTKHPYATIIDTIGEITIPNTIRYLLYTKDIPIKSFVFTNSQKIISQNNSIIQEETIFTIDPIGSRDLDDALSIRKNETKYIITTYISDVVAILEQYQLWNRLTSQVATLYTRDKIFSLLPRSLSNNICSLLEGQIRNVICTEFTIEDNEIIGVKLYSKKVLITTNYYYEENRLVCLECYQELYKVLQNLKIPFKYEINNSHDVVEVLMILTNYYSAKELAKKKAGIFRKVEFKGDNTSNGELEEFLSRWKWMKSEYVSYDDTLQDNLHHDMLQLDIYTHITSPIRRLVDILNQIVLYNFNVSNKAIEFYTKWIKRIETINKSMKAIKKIERYSTLLYHVVEYPDKIYRAYILDQNQVYIPDLQQVYKLKTIGEDNQKISVKVYIFWNDYKQKIRLMQVN